MQKIIQPSFYLSILFSLSLSFCSAQLKDLSKMAQEYLKNSDSLFKAKNYKQTISQARKALRFYEKLSDEQGLAHGYSNIGFSEVLLGKLKVGKDNLDKSLVILESNEQNSSRIKTSVYEGIARYYNRTSDYDSALKNYSKALRIQNQELPLKHVEIAKNHINMAVNYFMTSSFKLGEKHLDTVSKHLKQVKGDKIETMARYYGTAAILKHGAGYFKEAIPLYEKQIAFYSKEEKPFKVGIAKAYGNIGGAYNDLWNVRKGEEYIKKALEMVIEVQGENTYNVSSNYQNLARIYSKMGNAQKALNYNKKALEINTKLFPDTHYNIGTTYESMAATYSRMNDFENELFYYNKCLNVYRSIFGEKHKKIAILYENIGRVNRKKGNLTSSIEYLKRAIEIGEQIFQSDNVILASMYQNLAESYSLNKEHTEAETLFEKALQLRLDVFGPRHVEVAESYNARATYLSSIGSYDLAIEDYDKVLEIYQKIILEISNEFYANQEFHVLRILIDAVEGKAKCLHSIYKNDLNKVNLEIALKLMENAQVIAHKMRQVVSNHKDRTWVSEYNHSVPERGIALAYDYFKENKDPRVLERAFEFSEKNRSNTLRDFVESSIQSSGGTLGKIIELESELKAERSSYLSKINEIKTNKGIIDSTKLVRHQESLLKTNIKYDSLVQEIKEETPHYFNLGYINDKINLNVLRLFLDNRTSFLEFFELDNVIYAFIITNKNYDVLKLEVSDLDDSITEFKNAILEKDINRYKTVAQKLYGYLIKPLEKYMVGNKLIIVPHRSLWNVNFDLLLSENSTTNNTKNLPYLLKKYAISYANSAHTLLRSNKRDNNLIDECLAFSYANTETTSEGNTMELATLRDSDADLPGSRMEIKEISEIVNGKYYYGEHANEAAFKKNAFKYSILHLAIHGEVDSEDPENSKLYFSQKKDSIEDNILFSHELLSLKIPANLVVLSACNTGGGKITSVEGIKSLGSAFQYAGAKSLLISAWEVSDETTPIIMKKFYTFLQKGMDKSIALQQAKLQYLEEADVFRSDPFYWGSFYIVGDTSPLKIGKSYFWLYTLITLLVVTMLIIYAIKHLKK